MACLVTLSAQADGREYAVPPYLWFPTIALDSADTHNPGGAPDGYPFGLAAPFID